MSTKSNTIFEIKDSILYLMIRNIQKIIHVGSLTGQNRSKIANLSTIYPSTFKGVILGA